MSDIASSKGNGDHLERAPDSLWARLSSKGSLLWLAIFVGVPNLLFLVISPWIMLRRAYAPVLYVIAGVLSLLTPRPLTYLWFLAAAATDIFLIISLAFGMPFSVTLESLRFMGDVDIAASATYVLCALAAVMAVIACGYLTNRYRPQLRGASPLLATVFAFLLFATDMTVNGYAPEIPDQPDGVLLQTGLTSERIVANNRNVLFVLVEGLGSYVSPQQRQLLAGKLEAASGRRFVLKHGTSNFYGSTTGAESRELCGRWGTFLDYLDDRQYDCLPARLSAAGFETSSFHAHSSDLFIRDEWYPRIGIQKIHFRKQLEEQNPELASRLCGSTHIGLCDPDVGNVIHEELAKPSDKKKFVYWLTLNSHIPYNPIEDGKLKCGHADAAIANQMVCDLTEIWAGVFDAVAAIAADPTLPPLDIVVVGDHSTPMWSRAAAAHFVPNKVDWYYLEYAGDNKKAPAVTSEVSSETPPASTASIRQ